MENKNEIYGNQCESDNTFTRRARLLQSMYRMEIGEEEGVGPTKASKRKYGNMISGGDVSGKNFLMKETFEYAKERVKNRRENETMDEFRLFNNLLSSMPMAFNLFHPLIIESQKSDRNLKRHFIRQESHDTWHKAEFSIIDILICSDVFPVNNLESLGLAVASGGPHLREHRETFAGPERNIRTHGSRPRIALLEIVKALQRQRQVIHKGQVHIVKTQGRAPVVESQAHRQVVSEEIGRIRGNIEGCHIPVKVLYQRKQH